MSVSFPGKKRYIGVPFNVISVTRGLVEFLSYINLHFHFTLMQKFKFWYQLEGNSIRNNFGPSVQRSFQLGGQGAPPGGATHRTYGNRCIS